MLDVTELFNIEVKYVDVKKSARYSQVLVVIEFVVSGIQCKRTLKFGLRTLQYLYVEVSWEECFGGDEPGFGRVRVGLQALPRSPHEPRLVRARRRVHLHSHRHHDVNTLSQRQHAVTTSISRQIINSAHNLENYGKNSQAQNYLLNSIRPYLQWRIQDFPMEAVTYYYRPQIKFAKVMFSQGGLH